MLFNELVSVALREGSRKGVVYTQDPQDGWVSVLVRDGGGVRLLVVRPDIVTFTGEICEDPPILPAVVRAGKTVVAGQVADGFRARNVDAKVEDGVVLLLGGAVRVVAPFTVRDVLSCNETVLARVMPILTEIRAEIE